jgi:hypothetical protein
MLRRTISQETVMSFASDSAPEIETLADPKALLRVPVGLTSPLWPLFAGAAVSGAAWWWMTRWAQPANLEAMFGAAGKAEAETVEAVAEAVVEPLADAATEVEPVVEAVADAVTDPVVEASPEPVFDALVQEPAAPEPVGGESAPISPVLEAIAPQAVETAEAAKPKKRSIAPKVD